MEVKILTFVTNLCGSGPGHSAVAVDKKVYTFEDIGGGWLQSGSGWKILDYDPYLQHNAHRPILIQTIRGANPSLIVEYVNKSIKNDDDYGGSGVCSTQVSKAVNYSLPKEIDFDPFGFDTPHGVYYCARNLHIVTSEEYIWAEGRKPWNPFKNDIIIKLMLDYPLALKGLKETGQI